MTCARNKLREWLAGTTSFSSETGEGITTPYAIHNDRIWVDGASRNDIESYALGDGSYTGSIDVLTAVGNNYGLSDKAVDGNGYIWVKGSDTFTSGEPHYILLDPVTNLVHTSFGDAGDGNSSYGDVTIKYDSLNRLVWVAKNSTTLEGINIDTKVDDVTISADATDGGYVVDPVKDEIWVYDTTANTFKVYVASTGVFARTLVVDGTATNTNPRAIYIAETEQMLFVFDLNIIEIWSTDTYILDTTYTDTDDTRAYHYTPITDEIYGLTVNTSSGEDKLKFFDRATLTQVRYDLIPSDVLPSTIGNTNQTGPDGEIYGNYLSPNNLYRMDLIADPIQGCQGIVGAAAAAASETSELNFPNAYNRELILDLTSQAFYVYDMGHSETPTAPLVHAYIPLPKNVLSKVNARVFDENGVIVTDAGGDDVHVLTNTSGNRARDLRFENFKFLSSSTDGILFSEYISYTFLDWTNALGAGIDFSSYLITAPSVIEDLMKRKQVIYAMTFCNRTETVYTQTSNGVELARQSSCKVQSRWDWSNLDTQGKWGTEFEAYRFLLPQPPNPVSGDPFIYGDTVITTKNKLRGRGRAISLKFTASTGKDLQLQGWGILKYGTDSP